MICRVSSYNYGSDHQECLAHVLRYLQDRIENEPELTWNVKMKEFLSSLIHSFKSEPHLYLSIEFSVKRPSKIQSLFSLIWHLFISDAICFILLFLQNLCHFLLMFLSTDKNHLPYQPKLLCMSICQQSHL